MSSSTRAVVDYYELLGVSPDATPEEIKKAFRRLARECHPDVAGDDPEAAARFARVRRAYETLSDPVKRARYDGRTVRRRAHRWTRDGYRMPGGFTFRTGRPEERRAPPPPRGRAGNDLGLDDLFGPDFGFGGARPGARPAPERRPGRDIAIRVDVPERVARRGGTVTLRYARLVRSDDGAALRRVEEIHDLRVPPGTMHGSTLRVPRMGDCGTDGGPDGDLVCDIRVVSDPRPEPEPVREGPAPEAVAEPEPELRVLPVTLGEAVLGGAVEIDTPRGRVRLRVPPGSSSGTRLRLRGRGRGGGDLLVELRIALPERVGEEARRLVERFMELHPYDPRRGG